MSHSTVFSKPGDYTGAYIDYPQVSPKQTFTFSAFVYYWQGADVQNGQAFAAVDFGGSRVRLDLPRTTTGQDNWYNFVLNVVTPDNATSARFGLYFEALQGPTYTGDVFFDHASIATTPVQVVPEPALVVTGGALSILVIAAFCKYRR